MGEGEEGGAELGHGGGGRKSRGRQQKIYEREVAEGRGGDEGGGREGTDHDWPGRGGAGGAAGVVVGTELEKDRADFDVVVTGGVREWQVVG